MWHLVHTLEKYHYFYVMFLQCLLADILESFILRMILLNYW